MSAAKAVEPPRDPQKAQLLRIYTALAERFGPQRGRPRTRAVGRPVFAADACARRVFARHRLVPPAARSTELRAFAEAHLPSDPRLFAEFHALLVAVGRRYCRAVPLCGECPLRPDLGGRRPRAI